VSSNEETDANSDSNSQTAIEINEGSSQQSRRITKTSLDVHKCTSYSCEICQRAKPTDFKNIESGIDFGLHLERTSIEHVGEKLPKKWWDKEEEDYI